MFSLSSLPTEILELVAEHTDVKSASIMTAVSREMGPVFWKASYRKGRAIIEAEYVPVLDNVVDMICHLDGCIEEEREIVEYVVTYREGFSRDRTECEIDVYGQDAALESTKRWLVDNPNPGFSEWKIEHTDEIDKTDRCEESVDRRLKFSSSWKGHEFFIDVLATASKVYIMEMRFGGMKFDHPDVWGSDEREPETFAEFAFAEACYEFEDNFRYFFML